MQIYYDCVDERKPKLPPPKFIIFVLIALAIIILIFWQWARAEEVNDTLAVRAIVGEASNQGYHGLLAVAVGIRNRGTLQGIYGLKARHIWKEPKWVWNLAKKAWKESEYNRIHSATHWENIKAFGKPYWIKSMILVYQYKNHNFYKVRNK